ncbi:ParB/RepB/Spo0J family partition protein [Gloeobacter violaceus]|uniref:ParB family chromosome partitioning protein n=1 Tax=Gloeobacter violaceus (strain ATCC 29082 / PCC 7421) TaxID=251221 RepID=Q7NG23_GLOVI|nr:ParB/RepB/Spo0J family partition protein [Gloeobacter violaceus]BAC91292.1 ParB family chromosome partitioning protein [Gloeobacter violaceus PCC 7421]
MMGSKRSIHPEEKLKLLEGPHTETVGGSLRLDEIVVCCSQPRRFFDSAAMGELIESIRRVGILQPLLVRPLANGKYELVAGERRFRAARAVGLEAVPVVIRQLSDTEAVEQALVENLQRESLNPLEETESILQLLALKLGKSEEQTVSLLYRLQNASRKKTTHNVIGSTEAQTVEAVFASVGKMTCESFVNNRLPLRNMPHDVFKALREGRLAYTKARVLAQVKDRTQREMLLKESLQRDLSLSQLRQLIKTTCGAPEPEPLLKRLTTVYRRIKKLKWEDPLKRARFEALITELDSLIGDQ